MWLGKWIIGVIRKKEKKQEQLIHIKNLRINFSHIAEGLEPITASHNRVKSEFCFDAAANSTEITVRIQAVCVSDCKCLRTSNREEI